MTFFRIPEISLRKRVYLSNITGAYQVVLPYSCAILQAYSSQFPKINNSYEFLDYIFHVPNGVDEVLKKITNPSVFGFSLLSWNRRRSLKLAKLVKEKFPDCLIIVGGPEVPDDCSSFLEAHDFIDLAVHKEGEIAFSEILLENLNERKDWTNIGGVSFRDRGHHFQTTRSQGFLNPIKYPSPYLMGLLEESIGYVDYLGLPRHTIWETNRGCPFSCTYCDWGSFVNQRVRPVDENRVFSEIDYIGKNFNEVHIADANFGILPRDLKIAKALSKAMTSENKLHSVHITYTKNLNRRTMEIAKIMESLKPSRAGFTFGIQSFNKQVLKNVKRNNIPQMDIKKLKEDLDRSNIPTNAELILGLPGETKETFLNGIQEAIDLGLTDLRVYQVSMYPNSEMNNSLTIENFSIETEGVLIVEGEEEDENEFIETVVKTRDLSRSDMWFVKKLVEMIDHLHFGKWTYYLAKYLESNRKIRVIDFYESLARYFFDDKNSVIGKIARGVYINEWNSGSWNSYRGPKSPFGIKWGDNFFRKSTFFWLCIAEERAQFFKEIRIFLESFTSVDSELLDLLAFQDEMIINFSYDPSLGKECKFDYNWFSFFFKDEGLIKKQNILRFEDTTIGRFKHKLKPNDPQSYFYVAGGYKFHFQKIDSFVFSKLKISYNKDFHEDRFEYKKIDQLG